MFVISYKSFPIKYGSRQNESDPKCIFLSCIDLRSNRTWPGTEPIKLPRSVAHIYVDVSQVIEKRGLWKHAMCNLTNSMTYMHVFAYGGHNYSIYLHLGNLIQYLVLSVSRKKVLMYPKKIWYSLDIYFTSMDYRITTYNAGHLHMMNVNKAKSWSFYVTREKNWWEIYAWFFAYQTGSKNNISLVLGYLF